MPLFELETHEFIHVDQKKTSYLAAGPKHGPLLIFVHGWPSIARVWKPQLEVFSALGFRAVAPDMPGTFLIGYSTDSSADEDTGYGRSSARKVAADYSMEIVNKGMVALLNHLGRDKAIWIGLAVPCRTLELGLERLLETVDRAIYPADKYEFGQWSYQVFYERDFEKATAWFDKDPEAILKKLYVRGSAKTYGLPVPMARVTEDGGWFGGASSPDKRWRDIPISKIALDQETFDELVSAMKRTGFWGADAWYYNHKENRQYALLSSANNGYLHMPVLFIEAKWDGISQAGNPKMSDQMRQYCLRLTQCTIEAGHWVAEEKPQETSAAISRWILENCPEHWPNYWDQSHITSHL